MQTSQIISLLLFLSGWMISCFPTKPLNERSTELTWQAWLLIDESQNKQQDNSLRRRITPKSVFIAPTFSPESFPECSEGYQSDSMGRCIKIIMLNKELHLDFLLRQLNDKFGGGMDDYEDEEGTTAGPLNINIPLSGEAQEETDVAIVVAPTNGIVRTESGTKTHLNSTFNGEKLNVGDIAGILGLRQAAEVETTTITGTSTSNADSTTQESTTRNVESTTLNSGGSTSEFNALFFLDPKRQVEIKTENHDNFFTSFPAHSDFETTETDFVETSTKMKAGITKKVPDSLTDLPFLQMDQALPYSDTLITFSDTKREAVKSNKHEMEVSKTEPTSNTLTTETTTILPETKFNNIYQLSPSGSFPELSTEVKVPQSTSATMVLTPIDNSLSNHDVFQTGKPTSLSTESIFSIGFQKPNYETLFNNNKKIVSHISESTTPKSENLVWDTTEPPTTTTEVITTTDFQVETSTNLNLISASETIAYSTNIPEITVPTENVLSVSERNKVKFPTQTSQLIRFPEDVSSSPDQASTNVDHMLDASKQFEAIFKQYVSTRGADLSENQTHIFPNNQGVANTRADLSQTLYQRYKAHRDNHRNRDKDSEWYHLPPKWSDTSQKPVVLRFSRKHGYIDTQQLGSNNFYREINPRLFGFPAKSRVHR